MSTAILTQDDMIMTEFDGNTHFNALLSNPGLHAAFAFRSQAEIDQHTLGSTPNAFVTHDTVMNAARILIPPGDGASDSSLPLDSQLRPTWPLISKTTGHNEISIQFEVYFDPVFLRGVVSPASDVGCLEKAYQIAQKFGDQRGIEFQFNYENSYIYTVATDATVVAVPTIHVYDTIRNPEIDPIRQSNGEINPLRDGSNWQPGGDTVVSFVHGNLKSINNHLSTDPNNNPFLLQASKWIRITTSITFTGGQQRIRVWMQHEDEAQPTLVIAHPTDRSQGFLIDTAPKDSGADHFWVEWDSSQPRAVGSPELVSWFRNLVVFGDSTVPLMTGSSMQTATQSGTISIAAGTLAVASPRPPSGQIGKDYSHTFLATGGVLPYKWRLNSGFIWPPGLVLTGNVLSGRPLPQGGNYDYEIEVTDSST